jgi:murein DD-endopeptidase MepM/ murein hydrolase activator NlpD
MSHGVNTEACPICGDIPYDSERRVLVVGTVRVSYCSQTCLRVGVNTLQRARRTTRLRRWAVLLSLVLAAAGVGYLRHLLLRYLAQQRARAMATTAAPPPVAPDAPPEPIAFGPTWPPTDEEWLAEFTRATWVYPLPGPLRRHAAGTRELFPVDAKALPPQCRAAGHCGVDLGGELWGEHVYAAADGIIDRVRRSTDDAPGGTTIRIAHWGGAVFTSYFHLAAVPTRLAAGMHVNAGDVIGLVGDTGAHDAHAHLRFALSVRPSTALPEIYWDPEPLMAAWPLRTPARGSVAGLVAVDAPAEPIAGPSTGAPRHVATPRRPR